MGDGRLTDSAWELERERRRYHEGVLEGDTIRRLWREPTDSAILNRIDFALRRRYGEEGCRILETNAEAKALHDCAVSFIHELVRRK